MEPTYGDRRGQGRLMADGTWSGGFGVIRPGWQLYLGAVGQAAEHAHHAIQIVVADGQVELRDGEGRRQRCQAAVIPANEPHAIVEGNPRTVMLYLEPESTTGRELAARGFSSSVTAWAEAARTLTPALLSRDDQEPEALVCRIFGALGVDCRVVTGVAGHPVLEDAIQYLPTIISGPVSLAEVSAAVGISDSRLRHLFASEIGLSFRRYVLWLRLQRAVESVLGGSTLTEAAHTAGFTDSAHLTNVTRRTFGLAPSLLARAVSSHPPSEDCEKVTVGCMDVPEKHGRAT
ncbi:AraC family transcriptional regulator [Lentzea sp. NPDC003310]|uniref:AraC family transcriptional regulator n=1 Tax=Lentzea sp. NPDC003310 TaxID=3154447 RepID=UPI0033BE9D8D